jgi:hypothetical protein
MRAATHHYATRQSTRHYESSLDIYHPPRADDGNQPRAATHLVVLVVGSAWLGHLPPVYVPTAWWNASAPRTFAEAGAVCVCVRHRGAFPLPPPALLPALAIVAAATAATLVPSAPWMAALCAAVGMWLLHHLWLATARASASHTDMMEDVAQALAWVRLNRGLLCDTPELLTTTWFGGYSSGANVAASVLAQPDSFFSARGLPPPSTGELCDGVIHLSGVFGDGDATRKFSVYRLLCVLVFGAENVPKAPLADTSRVPHRPPAPELPLRRVQRPPVIKVGQSGGSREAPTTY